MLPVCLGNHRPLPQQTKLTQPRKIAWSKQGCIAYVTQDASRVNLRHLECRPTDGKWVLSDDTQLLPVTEVHGGHPLVHLCWNELGSELAVVDSSGRVSIYNISFALNTLSGQRQGAFDPDDDGAQIVGMMWLNVHRSVRVLERLLVSLADLTNGYEIFKC